MLKSREVYITKEDLKILEKCRDHMVNNDADKYLLLDLIAIIGDFREAFNMERNDD